MDHLVLHSPTHPHTHLIKRARSASVHTSHDWILRIQRPRRTWYVSQMRMREWYHPPASWMSTTRACSLFYAEAVRPNSACYVRIFFSTNWHTFILTLVVVWSTSGQSLLTHIHFDSHSWLKYFWTKSDAHSFWLSKYFWTKSSDTHSFWLS